MKKGSHHSPESNAKNKKSHQGKPCSDKAKEVNRERWLTNNPAKDPDNRAVLSLRMQKDNPMFNSTARDSMAAKKAGVGLSNEHIEKIREGTKEALSDPEVRARMSESHKDVPRPQWVRDKIGKGNEGKVRSEEARNKIRKSREGKYCGENAGFYGKTHNEESVEKIREAMILSQNDIWYGGVKYPDSYRIYCEKWNAGLRERIRAFWGYKSALSGKTSKENGNRALSCHHVYYHKKACCEWDEDIQGYYTWICGEKYYIKGDPNKFVTLTTSEHKIIDNDRLYWAKYFEDLILSRGGKSYFTHEEMKQFISENSKNSKISLKF